VTLSIIKHSSLIKNKLLILLKITAYTLLAFYLTSCAVKVKKDGPPKTNVNVDKIPNATPQNLPRSQYGNRPYTSINGIHYNILNTCNGYDETGMASWYGTKFHGHLTSTRETYDVLGMTAAHRTLPLPCFVRVTNLSNGKSVIVKVNDRGPFAKNRIIDLSYAAAKKLQLTHHGTARVRVTSINLDENTLSIPPQQTQPLYLQMGAFHLKNNAINLKNKITQMTNYPVLIKEALLNGDLLYKVQVGPVTNSQDVATLKSLIP